MAKRKRAAARVRNLLIRECYQVNGDWFIVTGLFVDGKRQWWMERAVLWAVIEDEGRPSRVRAINHAGLPAVDPSEVDEPYYVYGPDMSPAGVNWKELYDRTPPDSSNVRDITDSLKDQ